MAEPFDDSRRLTGCNLYFEGTGAALESAPGLAFDAAAVARWQANIRAACAALGWPLGDVFARRHASGVSLAFAAPFDQLYAATEVNEWAWCDALGVRAVDTVTDDDGNERPHAASFPRDEAIMRLRALAQAEAKPALVALQRAASARGVPFLVDDDAVSIGMGEASRTWPLNALPEPDAGSLADLHAMPAALVTGSNGKTTTVRLLAAMLRAHGLHTAHSCTEGVYFDNALIEGGDFSGPGGARTALRHPQAQAAVLETARGGILRRGLALCRVDAAIVTNISADHYGEYGVHGLEDLAAVKLVVARAVVADGLLVVNADDAVLRTQAADVACPLGWFAADFDAQWLARHRQRAGKTCGVRAGRLLLNDETGEHDLGAVADMPMTLGGRALYNIANASAAALAARALRVPVTTIAAVLSAFGKGVSDNPGRLQLWQFGDARVVVDYAHNPDGLDKLLHALGAPARAGRLTVVLGHAGNREDDDLRAVATTIARHRPGRVILKDISGYERGRAPGEIAGIMRAALIEGGVDAALISNDLDEASAACQLLEDMRADDLVVLPLHAVAAREQVVVLLEHMHRRQWRPGAPLPVHGEE